MCLLRINLPNLCPNMNHFDAVDFSECYSEEVISFFWRSVYMLLYYKKLYILFYYMLLYELYEKERTQRRHIVLKRLYLLYELREKQMKSQILMSPSTGKIFQMPWNFWCRPICIVLGHYTQNYIHEQLVENIRYCIQVLLWWTQISHWLIFYKLRNSESERSWWIMIRNHDWTMTEKYPPFKNIGMRVIRSWTICDLI